jgi:hypothetical protein
MALAGSSLRLSAASVSDRISFGNAAVMRPELGRKPVPPRPSDLKWLAENRGLYLLSWTAGAPPAGGDHDG